jgi:phage-related protein
VNLAAFRADLAHGANGAAPAFGSGLFEIALPSKGEACRVIYAVQLGDDIWVLQKAHKGSATPKHEIGLVKERLKRVKEMLA